jgi:hypothetical protein
MSNGRETEKSAEHKLQLHKKLLVQSVRTRILPVFLQQRFSMIPRANRGPFDQKNAQTFPFDLLRRSSPGGGVDLVDVQFMTFQRPAFRINACAVPKDGLMTLGGHRSADELEAGGLHEHFEMYAFPRWRMWFSLRFWRFRAPVQLDYDKLAMRVTDLLPEVELALREGKLGPHMRRIVIPIRASHEVMKIAF